MEEMNNLIKKYNNIERNTGFVERYYHLGGKSWYLGNDGLWLNDRRANDQEIIDFLKLKKELE